MNMNEVAVQEEPAPVVAAIAVGEKLGVWWGAGARSTSGVVVRVRRRCLEIRLASPSEGVADRYGLRRVDADGRAWYAECSGRTIGGPRLIGVTAPNGWVPVESRRAARFAADRLPVVAESLVADGPRRELVVLDLSASGCLLTGAGTASLQPGTKVRLSFDTGSYVERRWIHGVIVRGARGSFGRFDLGLRFEPATDAERAMALAWRDSAASRWSDRDPVADACLVER